MLWRSLFGQPLFGQLLFGQLLVGQLLVGQLLFSCSWPGSHSSSFTRGALVLGNVSLDPSLLVHTNTP